MPVEHPPIVISSGSNSPERLDPAIWLVSSSPGSGDFKDPTIFQSSLPPRPPPALSVLSHAPAMVSAQYNGTDALQREVNDLRHENLRLQILNANLTGQVNALTYVSYINYLNICANLISETRT